MVKLFNIMQVWLTNVFIKCNTSLWIYEICYKFAKNNIYLK